MRTHYTPNTQTHTLPRSPSVSPRISPSISPAVSPQFESRALNLSACPFSQLNSHSQNSSNSLPSQHSLSQVPSSLSRVLEGKIRFIVSHKDSNDEVKNKESSLTQTNTTKDNNTDKEVKEDDSDRDRDRDWFSNRDTTNHMAQWGGKGEKNIKERSTEHKHKNRLAPQPASTSGDTRNNNDDSRLPRNTPDLSQR